MCRITHTWARDPRGWADHWGHCGTQEQVLADEMGHFLGQQQDGCVSTSLAGHGFHFGDVTGTTAVNSSHFFNEMWGVVPLLGHGAPPTEVCESHKPSHVLWRQEISYCAKLLVEIYFGAFLKEGLLAGRLLCHFVLPSQESALAKCTKLEPPYTSQIHCRGSLFTFHLIGKSGFVMEPKL